VKHRNRRG